MGIGPVSGSAFLWAELAAGEARCGGLAGSRVQSKPPTSTRLLLGQAVLPETAWWLRGSFRKVKFRVAAA